jgi:diacylglycerol O-acyltransferase
MDRALLGYQREHPAEPVTVAYLLRVAGPVRLEALRADVLDRARRFPALTHRVFFSPGRAALPVWAPDPRFDVTRHVREYPLPAGPGTTGRGIAGPRSAVARLSREALPLDVPPWEICLLRAGGGTWLLFRASHVWLDGTALHRVLTLLFGDMSSLQGNVPACGGTGRRATPWVVMLAAGRLAGWVPPSGRVAALTGPAVAEHQMHWATTGVDRLRAVARGYDATVNDVFLVALAGALHAWSPLAGAGSRAARQTPAGPGAAGLAEVRRLPRALVPVSVRRPEERNDLGNVLVGARVTLPSGEASPWRRFELVRRQTARYQRGAGAGVGERWWFDRIPARFAPASVAMGMDQRRVAVTTSNLGVLPGPLAVAGEPVTAAVPVPVAVGGQRLSVMLAAYGPTACLTVAANPGPAARPGSAGDAAAVLARLWLAELADLEAAAGSGAVPVQPPAPARPTSTVSPSSPSPCPGCGDRVTAAVQAADGAHPPGREGRRSTPRSPAGL